MYGPIADDVRISGSLGGVAVLLFGTLRLAELSEVSHGSQEMMQQGRGIAQVLKAVARLQGKEYLLKDVDTVHYPGVSGDIDVLRGLHTLSIHLGILAGEMYPIDSPGATLGRAVGVGHVGGKNEVLPLAHLMLAAVNPVPSIAINTIDEYILAYRHLAVAVVV